MAALVDTSDLHEGRGIPQVDKTGLDAAIRNRGVSKLCQSQSQVILVWREEYPADEQQ